MSSPVMTWTAEAVSERRSGRFDTEVTSMSMSCSRLSLLRVSAEDTESRTWAAAEPATIMTPTVARKGPVPHLGRMRGRNMGADSPLLVQDPSNLPRQGIGGEGLLDVGDAGLEDAMPEDCVVRVARGVQHLDVGRSTSS